MYFNNVLRDVIVIHNYIRHEDKSDQLFKEIEGRYVEELLDLHENFDPHLAFQIQEHSASVFRDSFTATMLNFDMQLQGYLSDPPSIYSMLILESRHVPLYPSIVDCS